eukprot:jgi/Botrbrau1/2688/Bobra.0203s0031.1
MNSIGARRRRRSRYICQKLINSYMRCSTAMRQERQLYRMRCQHVAQGHGVVTDLICFDEITHVGDREVFLAPQTFDPMAWQKARREALQQVESAVLLRAPPGQGKLVIVDDNMHYRSMRHVCYKLARKHGASFAQLYISAQLERAIASNAGRPAG